MVFWLDILSIALCLLLAGQDLRSRKVSIVLLLLLFLNVSASSLVINSFSLSGEMFLINFFITAIYLLALFGWFSLRNKKLTNLFQTYLGPGDALFLLCLCAGFSGPNFIAFITISLLVTLISTAVIYLVRKPRDPHIPMVTYLGLLYCFLLIFKLLNPGFNPYDEAWLLESFYE